MKEKFIRLSYFIILAIYTFISNGQSGKLPSYTEKQKHRRVENDGEITSKKIPTKEMMSSIQIGIKNTMKNDSNYSGYDRDVLIPDFVKMEACVYPKKGTKQTPPHEFQEFTFKTYSPIIFNRFRQIIRIEPNEYTESICSFPLRELPDPGSSGSLFYITQDDKFILKTIQYEESENLQEHLYAHYLNLKENPYTLLPNFFGLYRYQRNLIDVSINYHINQIDCIRLVVMNNLLPTNVIIHEKYDLKGSNSKRKASKQEISKSSPTFKELDFENNHPNSIYLKPDTYASLFKVLQNDCKFLKSINIMGYSLLLGVHYVDQVEKNGENQSDDQSPSAVEKHDLPLRGIDALSGSGQRLLLFVGIIDVLQHYDDSKVADQDLKHRKKMSVRKSHNYAARFLKYMIKKVFKKYDVSPNQSSLEFKQALLNQNTCSEVYSSVEREDDYQSEETGRKLEHNQVDTKETGSEEETPVKTKVDPQCKNNKKEIKHKQVDNEGENTYGDDYSDHIIESIQLGIKHAFEYIIFEPNQKLLVTDFGTNVEFLLPPDDIEYASYNHIAKYKFTSYDPIIYHRIRSVYQIKPEEYIKSICSLPLHELSNPGASGSKFYKTGDDKYFIKTVQEQESTFLQKLLLGYYLNLDQNKKTLLPKLYGHYRYNCNSNIGSTCNPNINGTNMVLLVMNNLLPSNIEIHEKYDLKGSTHKRKASENELKKSKPSFKDLDFIGKHEGGFYLKPTAYKNLMKTLESDCRVLESFHIMDYSLLLGVHYVNHNQETEKDPIVQGPHTEEKYGSYKKGIPAKSGDGKDLLLFVGMIDILQDYRMKKKIEHVAKSVIDDGNTISVTKPDVYANRFLVFMNTHVFKITLSSQNRTNTLGEFLREKLN